MIRHCLLHAALLLVGTTALSGCMIASVIADKVAGDLPIEPAYKPDPLRPMVVIAENYRNPNNVSDAYRMQQIVSDRLSANGVAPILPSDRLLEVRDRSPTAYRKMSIVEIARAVGAEQVVYIDIAGVSVGTQAGGDVLKGIASANVKLIDVESGTVLYPRDLEGGAPVGFESEFRRVSVEFSPDAVRSETLMGLGIRIGQLFHPYQRGDRERINSYE